MFFVTLPLGVVNKSVGRMNGSAQLASIVQPTKVVPSQGVNAAVGSTKSCEPSGAYSFVSITTQSAIQVTIIGSAI